MRKPAFADMKKFYKQLGGNPADDHFIDSTIP